MRYPTLTRSKTERLARTLVAGEHEPNWELERDWVGSGHEVDLEPLMVVLAEMRAAFEQRGSGADEAPEVFEGRFAGRLHEALRELGIAALDDPGFWRYISLAHLWWFIAEREKGSIGRGNVMTYVDGGKECVPFRMFLRAQAIRDGDDYSLAAAIPRSTDFWRSHVIRVKTGTAPPLARSFAELQREKAMTSDVVRPFARRMNRLWTNIVFHTWEQDDCDRLLGRMYEDMEVERSGSGESS